MSKGGGNRGRGAAVKWLRDHAGYKGDGCLIWPFSRNGETGYGHFGYLGEMLYAHRFMCELVHGPAPEGKTYAAHHCGKGHEGCVHPEHIAWKTPYENALDRLTHGNNHKSGRKRNKLTPERAQQIRALKGRESQWKIARDFGVSQSTVSQIHRDVAWPVRSHQQLRHTT